MGHGHVKAFGEILSPAKVFESSRDLRLTLTHRGVVSHIGAKPLEVIGVHKPLVLSNVAFLVYRIDIVSITEGLGLNMKYYCVRQPLTLSTSTLVNYSPAHTKRTLVFYECPAFEGSRSWICV